MDLGERRVEVMAFHAQLGDVGQPCHHITTWLLPDLLHHQTWLVDGCRK